MMRSSRGATGRFSVFNPERIMSRAEGKRPRLNGLPGLLLSGGKNWVFSNTPRGAHASAGMYSLVESAKANKIERYHYLRYLFTNMPLASNRDELRKLLPCYRTEQ